MTVSAFGATGNGATGPASSVANATPFAAGLAFKVTMAGQSLLGYGLWRADSAQSAAPSFGLWTITGAATGTFVTGSGISGSGFVTGRWNYVTLAVPMALTSGTAYKAVYGLTGNFPDTQNQFGTGNPYVSGIINGPLTVYSDVAANGGLLPEPHGTFQGTFTTAGSDPTVTYPTTADVKSNFWVDILIGIPAGPAALQQQQSGRSMLRKRLMTADL